MFNDLVKRLSVPKPYTDLYFWNYTKDWREECAQKLIAFDNGLLSKKDLINYLNIENRSAVVTVVKNEAIKILETI